MNPFSDMTLNLAFLKKGKEADISGTRRLRSVQSLGPSRSISVRSNTAQPLPWGVGGVGGGGGGGPWEAPGERGGVGTETWASQLSPVTDEVSSVSSSVSQLPCKTANWQFWGKDLTRTSQDLHTLLGY